MSRVDVVIVGAGLSGALVASECAKAGLRYKVLEAGPLPPSPLPLEPGAFSRKTAPLLEVDAENWRYASRRGPLAWYRVRAAGGRSLLWGGWSVRPGPQTLSDARAFERPWPISQALLMRLAGQVERWLDVRAAPASPAARAAGKTLGLRVVPKRAATTPQGERPLTSLDRLARRSVQSHAVVLRVLWRPGTNLVDGVEWLDALTRRTQVLRARRVVLCASPVETARILSMSREPLGLALAGLGDGLCDHLISSVLVVRPEPAPTLVAPGPLEATAFLPRFVNVPGGRRRDYRSGFVTEVRGPHALSTLDGPTLQMLGVEAQAARTSSYFSIHALGESTPNPRRRVRFDPASLDGFGRPIPVFQSGFVAEDRARAADMEETTDAIADVLARQDGRIIVLRRALDRGDTGHEAGLCAMGDSARTHVTDAFGGVFGARGLYVADASLLPTCLDRHPTVTILALALRAAGRIIEEARRGDA